MSKEKIFLITKQELDQIDAELQAATLEAIKAKPETFRELGPKLQRIKDQAIDIDEWKILAGEIAGLLRDLCSVTVGTMFYHPRKNIDPDQYGRASTFRNECARLLDKIRKLKDGDIVEELAKYHLDLSTLPKINATKTKICSNCGTDYTVIFYDPGKCEKCR